MRNTVDVSNFNRPLAFYKSLSDYEPKVGDFIIWAGWFFTKYGIVTDFDKSSIYVVLDGLPVLLITMDTSDYEENTRKISISKIKSASKGSFSILQTDEKSKQPIWYL